MGLPAEGRAPPAPCALGSRFPGRLLSNRRRGAGRREPWGRLGGQALQVPAASVWGVVCGRLRFPARRWGGRSWAGKRRALSEVLKGPRALSRERAAHATGGGGVPVPRCEVRREGAWVVVEAPAWGHGSRGTPVTGPLSGHSGRGSLWKRALVQAVNLATSRPGWRRGVGRRHGLPAGAHGSRARTCSRMQAPRRSHAVVAVQLGVGGGERAVPARSTDASWLSGRRCFRSSAISHRHTDTERHTDTDSEFCFVFAKFSC